MKTKSKANVKIGKAKMKSGEIGARRQGNDLVLYPASLASNIADGLSSTDSMICN